MIPIHGRRAQVSFYTTPDEQPDETPDEQPAPPLPPLRLVRAPKTAREMIAAVANEFGLAPEDITSKSRAAKHVIARAVVIRLLRDRKRGNGEHAFSTPQIGWLLGRDHSTICHSLDQFGDYISRSPKAEQVYSDLRGFVG
jgi:chromosomal replication initiation ATPase DnaA